MRSEIVSRLVLPTVIADPLRAVSGSDAKAVKKRRGCLHAFMMLLCLVTLLATLYFSQEPYRYSVSSKAFSEALHISGLSDSELGVSDVWEWFDDLLVELGGESTRSVQLNCAYDDKKSQTVRINGIDYFLVDPALDDKACEKIGYIDGANEHIYLAGSHQILSFGAFSTRSRLERPRQESVIDSQRETLTVAESSTSAVSPSIDERVVKLCEVDGGPHPDSYCIAEDNFGASAGSTFGWQGKIVTANDTTYFGFNTGENASLFIDALHNYSVVYPCYTVNSAGGVTTTSGVPNICSNVWVTAGRDVRDNCLEALGDQATPLQAYVAALNNKLSVPELYDYNYGCTTLLSWPENEMDKIFMEQSRPLNTFLSSDSAYGSFFPTSSLKKWIKDAHHLSTQFQMSNALDEQSREFIVYLITRNLNENGLFYSRIKLTFTFSVEGSTAFDLKSTFSPMIDFSYGTNGHAWVFRETLVWESLMLFLFIVFTIREIYMLFVLLVPKKNSVSVQPLPTGQNNVLSVTEHIDDGSALPSRSGISVLEIEKDKTFPDLNNDNDKGADQAMYSSGQSNVDINSTPTEKIIKSDEYRSLSQRVLSFDFNGNGLGDLKEMGQFIEKTMPGKTFFGYLLDWITVAMVLTLLVLRIKYFRVTRQMHALFHDLADQHNYSDHMTNIVSKFETMDTIKSSEKLLLMIVMFVGMTQFFRYLSFDSRLGIVASTMLDSAKDLIPVLFIFIIVLTGYSVLGSAIFGHNVESWSTISGSMLNLMIYIVGEYGSYFEIVESQPAITAIYFWSYMIVAYFIIFNMILAVIFNVYNKKSDALLKENVKLEREKSGVFPDSTADESRKSK